MKRLQISLLILALPLFSFVAGYGYKSFYEDSYRTGDRILVPGIYYGCDHNGLIGESEDTLVVVADFMQRHPSYTIEIAVHIDERGSATYNLELTKRRARMIRDVLQYRYKVDTAKVKSKGYGETEPLISSDSIARIKSASDKEKAYMVNRRTEVRILKTE